MKKYLFIFKSELMSQLQYVFNTVVGFLGYFIMLFILFNLYRYLYADPSEAINGYTMNQMVWYVIFTEIIWSTTGGRKFVHKICDDVRGGSIAYNISKPYSYIGYSLASHLGEITFKGVIYTILAMLEGFLLLGVFPKVTILGALAIFLVSVLAIVISTLILISIGLLAFKIEDSNPIYWLYSKLILICGTIFPIEYFPAAVQPILNYSPVYVTTYGPARLFVEFNLETFLNVLLFQVIYLVLIYLLCLFVYRRGVRDLNVNGG